MNILDYITYPFTDIIPSVYKDITSGDFKFKRTVQSVIGFTKDLDPSQYVNELLKTCKGYNPLQTHLRNNVREKLSTDFPYLLQEIEDYWKENDPIFWSEYNRKLDELHKRTEEISKKVYTKEEVQRKRMEKINKYTKKDSL